eukprot:625765-Rhodomonas_salina.1
MLAQVEQVRARRDRHVVHVHSIGVGAWVAEPHPAKEAVFHGATPEVVEEVAYAEGLAVAAGNRQVGNVAPARAVQPRWLSGEPDANVQRPVIEPAHVPLLTGAPEYVQRLIHHCHAGIIAAGGEGRDLLHHACVHVETERLGGCRAAAAACLPGNSIDVATLFVESKTLVSLCKALRYGDWCFPPVGCDVENLYLAIYGVQNAVEPTKIDKQVLNLD